MAVLESTVLLATKQAACLRKDQTTRKETVGGEKLLPGEYLGILDLGYEKTTMKSHWHELGVVTKAMHINMASACAKVWCYGRTCTTCGPGA
jgi:hypothetical protein